MFAFSLVLKSYLITFSFLVVVLLLSNSTLIREEEPKPLLKKDANKTCLPVSAAYYFCTKISDTDQNTKDCFGAYSALYPVILGFFCVFAFAGLLFFKLKNQTPSYFDWISSAVFAVLWFGAFVCMCHVCVNEKGKNLQTPPTWIAATIFCLVIVLLLGAEIFFILRKPQYYYADAAVAKSEPIVMVKSEPLAVVEPPQSSPGSQAPALKFSSLQF